MESKSFVNMYSMLSFIIFSITAFGFLIPLLFFEEAINRVSNQGIFGETLRKSLNLKISESICIGCTLPMLVDIFLDGFSSARKLLTISMMQRTILLVSFSIASAAYLSFGDFHFMPFLYICLIRSKVLLLGIITFSVVSNGVISTIWKIPQTAFVVPILACGLFTIFECYSLIFLDVDILSTLNTIFFSIAVISFCFLQSIWFYCLWRQYHKDKSILDNEVVTEVVYMSTTLFYLFACEIVRASFGFTETWFETSERPLVGYSVVQVIVTILIAALPGRLIRNVAEV